MSQGLVALLRGINVGKAKRVAMADLRALLEDLGYAGVRTLLNSGNAVFTSREEAAAAASRIEKAIASRLGVSARVTVLTATEIAAAVRRNPLPGIARDPSRLMMAVPIEAGSLPRLEPLLKQDWKPEALALGRRVAYLWLPGGTIESRLHQTVERELGGAVTTRNWATVTKLHALLREEA
jgi:uncharacterized protein (DUF1697 family)